MTNQELKEMTELVIDTQDRAKEDYLKAKLRENIDKIEELKLDFLLYAHSLTITRGEIEHEDIIELADKVIDFEKDNIEKIDHYLDSLESYLKSIRLAQCLIIDNYNELVKVENRE